MPTEKQKSAPACWCSKSHSPQKNSWFLLHKTNEKAALAGYKTMDYSKMVRMKGLEPSRREAHAPKR